MAQKKAKAAKGKKKEAVSAKRSGAKIVQKSAKRAAKSKAVLTVASLSTASSIVEDHLAILQLLHKYCHAVDRGTAEDVAALFHRTAVLLPRYESDERYEGREAVRGWYQRYMENFRPTVRYLRHKIESPVIEITGNEATSVCYLDADAITVAIDEAMVVFGRYDDKFIKEGGRWWFKERAIIVYYTYPLAMYREGRGT